jgi:phenylalanyl-tRNA synthetase beta chain
LAGLEGPSTEVDGSLSLAIWRRLADVLRLDDVLLEAASPSGYHPGRTAAVSIAGVSIGHVGELAPSAAKAFELSGRVAVAELDLSQLLVPLDPVLAQSPSVFPFVDFDLSFLVAADARASDLVESTTSAGAKLVESARVFDEYKGVGEGRRALAIRYRLRAPDRTLSNEEVAPIRKAMIDAAAAIGAELRGV